MNNQTYGLRLIFVRLGLILVLTIMTLGSLLLVVEASAGDLDSIFGTNGIVFPPISTKNDRALDVALQSDGKIIIVGYTGDSNYDFVMARYGITGTLDPSFGSKGRVTTDFSGANDVGRTIAIQRDDKIIVVGSASNINFGMARYNSQGSLDPTFGNEGKVTTLVRDYTSDAFAVAVQSDDKIVVGGLIQHETGQDFALARYTITGTLDTTFGSGGTVTTSISDLYDWGSAIAIQPDGKIVMVGRSWGIGYDFALARYNPGGNLDLDFGNSGVVTTNIGQNDFASAVALQSDGKIVLAGSVTDEMVREGFALVRYTPTGTLDLNFGHNGIVTTFIGVNAAGYALVLQPDNKIVVAGVAKGGFALVRYYPNGNLDSTWGNGGIVTTTFGSGKWVESGKAVLQPDGKIVMAGSAQNGNNMGFALARYKADPLFTNHVYLPVILR
jgi:uncharacterized delta-60 repeat protein